MKATMLPDSLKRMSISGLPLLSGLLLGISFPTYPAIHLEILAWVALVPLLLSLEKDERFGSYLMKAYASMLVFCIVSLWWVSIATLPGGILTVIAQALFLTVPLMIFYFMKKSGGFMYALVALPFVWVGWEWAYMQQDLSLGWLTFGNSQANLIPMIQYADVTGVWGVSFWLVSFNVLTIMLLRNAGSRLHASLAAGMMAAMIAAPLIYSASVFSSENTRAATPTIKVTIVQPDIDPHEKWKTYDIAETMTLHYQLTARAVYENRPDLVLWPETAIPFYILDPRFDGYMNSLRQSLALWNVTLLTGFSDVVYAPEALASSDPGAMRYDRLTGRRYETFNSSMMLGPEEQNPQIYHKIRLVPFGERVPYMEYFPWLERFSFSLAGISSWSKGRDTTIMEFRTLRGKPVRTANIICYESIFPGLVAEFVSKGAQFLTLVTNDGWYGTSYGPYQHAAIGRFRCIENRRSMARCANTGITLFYDRYGRSYAEIPWWERKTLTADISLENDLTLYTRYPDLFPKASLGVAALFVAAALLLPRKKIGLP